ncbi:MAG: hypothetical protein JO359_04330 [Candidatus Eremiobacteraeota bacterium]|nr:hypothetical protein [Candidatus Eremiobacteraeota bacterium]
MATSLPPALVEELLRKHAFTPGQASNSHPPPPRGADAVEAALGGYRRGDGQKMIALTIGTFSLSQPWPVSPAEAVEIVERFRRRRLTKEIAEIERSLADALLKASMLYEDGGIETFVLQPVVFKRDGYEVNGARMFGSTTSV